MLDPVFGSDDTPLADDEIKLLAEVRDLPHFPAIRSALLRYQSRAREAIEDFESDLNRIREAQGRCSLARQFLDLLEHDAPAAYHKRQESHADQDDED
jgi:hypothetical protein